MHTGPTYHLVSIGRSAFALQELYRAAGTPRSEGGPAHPLPREPHSACQHQAPRALSCVCALSRFILCIRLQDVSVLRQQKSLREAILGVWECSNIFPYNLMVTLSSLYTFSAYKSFHRNCENLCFSRAASIKLLQSEC